MAADPCDGCRAVPRSEPRLALPLALVYAATFMWVGIYLPYWPVWLAERGMTAAQVGMLLGVAPWARLVASPAAGRWADRSGRPHRIVQGLAFALCGIVACFSVAQGFGALLGLTLVVGLLFAPIVPLTDGITLGFEARRRVNYGPVRLWGSVAFIAASWLGGTWVEHQGTPIVLWMMVGAAGLLALTSIGLPAGTRQRDPDTPVVDTAFSGRSRSFIGFLVITALLHGSHSVLYGFGTQHWLGLGIDEGTVGLLWAIGVVAEVVVFALPGIVRWLSPHQMWAVAGLAGVIRWPLLAFTDSLPWLVFAQVLHGLTFGALHLGAMAYIRQRVPETARSQATTLYSAVAAGLALGIGLPLVGQVYEYVQGSTYWLMTGWSGLGMLLALLIDWRQNRSSAVR